LWKSGSSPHESWILSVDKIVKKFAVSNSTCGHKIFPHLPFNISTGKCLKSKCVRFADGLKDKAENIWQKYRE
jgi:hypothetical protein